MAELVIEGLTKSFRAVNAVDDVSLSIAPGQMVGVIGRSGAGKSTMLRLVNRLADPGSALESALELAAQLAGNGPLALVATKRGMEAKLD